MTEKQYLKELEKIQLKNRQIEFKNKLKAEKKKYKRSLSTSNKVLIIAIMAVLLFTIACLYIQYKTGMEVSSTLITLWYSFWTVEIVSLAGIKVTKVLKKSNFETDVLDNFNFESEDSDIVG